MTAVINQSFRTSESQINYSKQQAVFCSQSTPIPEHLVIKS